MSSLKDLIQTNDWKAEKHVPVIEAMDKIKKGEAVKIIITVGKEIAHPNTTEHHIRWVEVYFKPSGEKFPYQLARVEFTAHGESVQGPNTSSVFTQAQITVTVKTEKSGTIFASAYCNIHGLWENSKELIVE
jgi:superoxide reductase